jgi:hypothetical protein
MREPRLVGSTPTERVFAHLEIQHWLSGEIGAQSPTNTTKNCWFSNTIGASSDSKFKAINQQNQ